jgi:hypothetical protein
MKKFGEWLQLREDNQRTGSKVGLYPPLYTLSQYPNAYYTPIAADYVTYHDIEVKNPTKTNPPGPSKTLCISPDAKGNLKKDLQGH